MTSPLDPTDGAAPDTGRDRRPVLPAAGRPLDDGALAELRRFHRRAPEAAADGAGEATAPAPEMDPATLPALLHRFRDGRRLRTDFPLFLAPPEDGGEALCLPLGALLQRAARQAAGEGADERLLTDNLPRLEQRVRRAAAGLDAPAAARELIAEAAAGMPAELDLAAAPAASLTTDLERLVEGIPAGGRLLPADDAVALHLLAAAAAESREPARRVFRAEAESLVERLEGALGETPGGSRDGTAGALGGRFFDPAKLAGLHRPEGGGDPGRRQRLAGARDSLRGYLAAGEPVPRLLHTAGDEAGRTLAATAAAAGWECSAEDDPCTAAAAAFDAAAAHLTGTLRAARLARLELAGDYVAERHGPWLEALDWRGFRRDELALLPPVVAWLAADDAAGRLASLSRLLLSGRAVQTVLPLTPAANPGAPAGDPLAGYRLEPGYLGIAHREAVVCQSSAVRPLHLMAGLRHAAAAGRAALHVLALPPAGAAADPWLTVGAALEGRAHPFFRYQPEAGATWSARLDFADNPAPGDDWPAYTLPVRRPDGSDESLETVFTFADYALLDPACAGHFRPLPDDAEGDALVPLAPWLELPGDEAAHRLPWIWAAGEDGRLQRLLVSRRLAVACRDRLDLWRTLQELAGVKSAYAREAAERARRDAEAAAAAERERLGTLHAEELERVRRQAASEVVDRLTAALLGAEPADAPAAVATGAPPRPAPWAPAVPEATVAAPVAAGVDAVAAALAALLPAEPGAAEDDADPRVAATASRLFDLLDLEELSDPTPVPAEAGRAS